MARLNQQHKIIDTLAIGTLAAMGGLLIGNGQSVAASTDVVATTVTQSAVSTPVATDENATASQDSNIPTTGEPVADQMADDEPQVVAEPVTGSESATEVSEPGETDHSSATTTAKNGVPATESTTVDQDTQT